MTTRHREDAFASHSDASASESASPAVAATPADSAAADDRAQAARAWAVAALGEAAQDFASASADASFRRYFRLQAASGSYIVMDAPPDKEDSAPFVRVAGLMQEAGLRVPRVLASDLAQGFLLLDDLGRQTCLEVMDEANAEAHFGRARAALILWQKASRPGVLPDYDAALLQREMQLFDDWYLGRHLQLRLAPEEAEALAAVKEALVQRALGQARVFVHRDFMPRNLMAGDDRVGVLDFQDAVCGPVSYDIVSLYRDAFRSWPPDMVDCGLRAYHREARQAGIAVPASVDDFLADCDWMGLQRHLKVLGIFARLSLRDGKPKYLADTPRFVRYVMQVAPRYPELQPLAALFERHVLPRTGGESP